MQALLLYALKTIIYSAIFFGYYCLALRNKRFHYYNRFYLLLTVLLSLMLPLFYLQLWQWNGSNTGVIKLLNVATVNDYEAIISSHSSALNWANVASICYCAIALGLLLAALFSVVFIFRLKAKYRVEKIESINFINTDLEQSPFSFFNNLFWKNTLSLSDEGGRQIFKHELTHIEQKHSWDKLFMRAVTALFWFNPLYWLAQKELALIHEFIADEKAVENKSAEAFALMILQSQYAKNVFSPAQSFHYSPIKRRLLMLTTSKKPSFSYARRIFVLPLLAITVLLFAFKLKKDEQGTAAIHTNAPFVLVVDAGHGGTENGAWGSNNIYEKDINLSIAKTIEKLAPEYGITVKLTRTEDATIPLQDRMSYIKSVQPDAFISLHVNATEGTKSDKNGMEVYISRVDSNANLARSKLLGSSIVKSLQSDFTTSSSLLQRREQGIYVIDANPYPAILVECGYMNNLNDLKQLTDANKMGQMARDILKGVAAYANANKNASLLNHDNGSNDALQSSTDTTKKPTPLYIVDGKETSAEDVNNMDKNKIESINVLKEAKAIKQYGDKGKNGVIEITLKDQGSNKQQIHRMAPPRIVKDTVVKGKRNQGVDSKPKLDTSEKYDKVLLSAQIAPSFPGGKEGWLQYLRKNIKSEVPTDHGAPFGKYTVIVSFIVDNNGKVSDVKAIKDPGYGTAAEAVRIIKEGPKWLPAIQNGKAVTAEAKQAITFQVEEGH